MFILCLCDSMSDSRKLVIIIKMCFSCIFLKIFIYREVLHGLDIVRYKLLVMHTIYLMLVFTSNWFFLNLLFFIRFHEKKIILFSDWLIHTLLKFYNLHGRALSSSLLYVRIWPPFSGKYSFLWIDLKFHISNFVF